MDVPFINGRLKALRRILFLAAAVFLSSCTSLSKQECSGVYTLEDMGWYRAQMKAAGVRPLCVTRNEFDERFRLIWLRSFHNPIVVTLVKSGESVRIEAVRLDGAGGYEPGKIVERKRVSISTSEYNEFYAAINGMSFWELKSYGQLLHETLLGNGEEILGTDGARWILEGANSKAAHAADRWSPSQGPFLQAALYLLDKSGINPNGPIY